MRVRGARRGEARLLRCAWRLALGALVAATWLGGSAGAVAASERVTIRMNWYWRGVQAPFALAKERGYYEHAGLDVELLEGRGSATTVQLVGNKSDTFGFADGFTVMVSAAQGMPVRAVATLLNGLSYAMVTLEDSPVRTMKDLEGRVLGVTPGDGHTQVWPAVVAATGLNAAAIRLVHMDPRAKGPALTERRVDAVLGSAADLPITLGLRGVRTRVFLFADLGVPLVGFTLVAHPDTIRERPQVVRSVVAASVRGFDEALRDPEAAIRALQRVAPFLDTEAARQQLPVDLSFLFSRANAGRRLGWGPPEDWQAMLEVLQRYRGLATSLPATAFYTNDFVP